MALSDFVKILVFPKRTNKPNLHAGETERIYANIL